MTAHRVLRLALAGLLAGTAFSASAYRPWLLPSEFVLDGPAPVVSVDAAGSEDLFKFDSTALQLDKLWVVAPNGQSLPAGPAMASRRHVSFDVPLPQKGTYRLIGNTDSVFASWKVGDDMKRWRGAASEFASAPIPADAQDLQVNRMLGRVETFVTREAPSAVAPSPAGPGLALEPLGSPTDLSVGDTTRMRLMLNGEPLANADVTVIRGDNRYRYKLGEIALKTGADGSFAVTWPEAGQWWLGVNHGARGPGAAVGPPAQRGSLPQVSRESYSATFEVLPK